MKARVFPVFTFFILIGIVAVSGCRKPDPAVQMGPIIDRYVKIWNTGNLEAVEGILHPDFELRMTPMFDAETGLEAFKESVTKRRTAYPDFHIDLEEVIIAQNAGAARWTITATHSGPGWDPPTGKTVKVPGMSVFHFEDGKLKDEWIGGNNSYWLRQLGYKLVPPEPAG
jgi:steroid delta-isomerase-like uncharacterized protein